MLHRFASLSALAFLLAGLAGSADENPTVKVAKMGKAATALVECESPGVRSHGSAFCVHPSGLFVTNEHVVANATSVRLILNSALKNQKIVKAEVLRRDVENDLALLRAEGVQDLPTLQLGDSDKVSELQDVIACGYPFGKSLTLVKDEYPSVSVNKGAITSLRNKGNQLHRIQVDVTLNPGNSGGALLDMDGKVVGVVVSGLRGTQVSFVIPVAYLNTFLAKPNLAFAAPKVSRDNRMKEATFEAKAVALVPGAVALDLELVLRSGGQVRRFPMKREGDSYRAVAVPMPVVEGVIALRAAFEYPDGSVTGSIRDRAVSIDGSTRKLSEIRAIRTQPPKVEFADGKTRDGIPPALDALEVSLGGETLVLKLAPTKSVTLTAPQEALEVACTVIAKAGGQVVAEASDSLNFPGTTVVSSVNSPAVGATQIEGDKVTRPLPGPVTDAVMAGGGRYLLLKIPSANQVAIFDVSQAKVTGLIPLAAENAKIAGGQEKLVIALPDGGLFQRWDIATRQREATVPVEIKPGHTIRHVAMGCASNGPVVFTASDNNRGSGEVGILDLATFKPQTLKRPRDQVGPHAECPLRASADGKTFGSFEYNVSPQSVRCITLHPGEVRAYGNGDSSGHVTPGDDGRFLFTGRGVYNFEGKAVGVVGREGPYCLPAVRGPFYLGLFINADGGQDRHKAGVYLPDNGRSLVDVKNVEWPKDMNQWDREVFAWDRRIWLVPEAKVLITLPDPSDRVVIHRLDIEARLAQSDVDYLTVTSRPPAEARKGATLSYEVKVLSKKGGVKCELVSGPTGMTVSESGQLQWVVPQNFDEKTVPVLMMVRDASGREIVHSFTLAVE